MMPPSSIAVLIACYNRKDKTLACLENLFRQASGEQASSKQASGQLEIAVYLVDDGSTDGTAAAVATQFPQVNVLSGSGSLFWNGSMAWAFSEALKHPHDYYLWLNDDTLLDADALPRLVASAEEIRQQQGAPGIIVGSIRDPDTQQLSYGGLRSRSRWNPFKYQRLLPSDAPQPCDTMNGNCVLIPRAITQKVGSLDPAFSHSIGDIDYGLRTRQSGYGLWVAPGFFGTCKNDSLYTKPWRQANLSFRERFRRLNQPKGLPFKERKIFLQRHAGVLWPLYWGFPYLKIAVLQMTGKLKDAATG